MRLSQRYVLRLPTKHHPVIRKLNRLIHNFPSFRKWFHLYISQYSPLRLFNSMSAKSYRNIIFIIDQTRLSDLNVKLGLTTPCLFMWWIGRWFLQLSPSRHRRHNVRACHKINWVPTNWQRISHQIDHIVMCITSLALLVCPYCIYSERNRVLITKIWCGSSPWSCYCRGVKRLGREYCWALDHHERRRCSCWPHFETKSPS